MLGKLDNSTEQVRGCFFTVHDSRKALTDVLKVTLRPIQWECCGYDINAWGVIRPLLGEACPESALQNSLTGTLLQVRSPAAVVAVATVSTSDEPASFQFVDVSACLIFGTSDLRAPTLPPPGKCRRPRRQTYRVGRTRLWPRAIGPGSWISVPE